MTENYLRHDEIMAIRYSENTSRDRIVSCLDGKMYGEVIADLRYISPAHKRLILASPYLYHCIVRITEALEAMSLRAERDRIDWLQESTRGAIGIAANGTIITTHGLDYWLKAYQSERRN